MYTTSVRDRFAAVIASTSLSPMVPAPVFIYIFTFVRDHFADGVCFLPCAAHRGQKKINSGVYTQVGVYILRTYTYPICSRDPLDSVCFCFVSDGVCSLTPRTERNK